MDIQINGWTDSQIDRETKDTQTNGLVGRHIERRKDEKTEGQTDGRIDCDMIFRLFDFSQNECHVC
jgi:hypothetical protein